MKVLHVIPSVALRDGGPARAIRDMERALTARGLDVTTATTNADGDERKADVLVGAPVLTPYATRWYFDRNIAFYKLSFGLGRWLKKNVRAFDIVHAHGLFSFAPIAAARIARLAGVPYVLRPLGVLGRYGMTQRRPMLKQLSLRFLDRDVVEGASAVHFTSLAEQTQAEELGLRCCGVVIPLGIELSEVAMRDGAADVSAEFLFLSRIDPIKNIEGLLRAVARVSAAHDTVRLRIAGDGNAAYVQNLKNLASDLGIAGRVTWLGHISGEQKQAEFARAAAFIQPSHWESFGIAVVEALAARVPCIVSRSVAVHDEILAAKAGLVTGTDAESLADGIARFLDSGQARRAMSDAAAGLAFNRFSLGAMGEQLERLYRRLAGTRVPAI